MWGGEGGYVRVATYWDTSAEIKRQSPRRLNLLDGRLEIDGRTGGVIGLRRFTT